MRITALILGIIGGLGGMVVGFFGYGYTEFIAWFGEIPDLAEQVDNVQQIRAASLISPILALVGGGMAISRPGIAGVLLLLSSAGMYWGFAFGVFTMFPITLCFVAGILSLSATGDKAA
jgi:membrane protein YqaA with SNARE-associated domain